MMGKQLIKDISTEELKTFADMDVDDIEGYFKTIEVTVPITPLTSSEKIVATAADDNFGRRNSVKFGNVHIDAETSSGSLKYFPRVEKIVEEINRRLHDINGPYVDSWAPFYFIKEFVQQLKQNAPELDFYYRGQSNDWQLLPSAMRSDLDKSYRTKFDDEYHKISLEYEDIKYVPIPVDSDFKLEDAESRARNIAYMQHFGMPTPFADITTNEFVAMFFMIDKDGKYYRGRTLHSTKFVRPSFDILFCPNGIKWDRTLIEFAPKNSQNVRMSAQSGSFLNFEKAISKTSIAPLQRVRITFSYSIKTHIDEYESLNSFISENDIDPEFIDDLKDMSDETQAKYLKELQDELLKARRERFKIRNELNSRIINDDIKEDELNFERQNMYELVEKGDRISSLLRVINNAQKDVLDYFMESTQSKLNEFGYGEKDVFPDLKHKLESLSTLYRTVEQVENKIPTIISI